ncbi:MAG: glycosyltransferase family 2 protein [Prevotella sp.]|nr:glycosyltransferase family 2 protein [Prevotella sp.]
MISELSIVIPTYNKECVQLVEVLYGQASQAESLRYEIIVADDGSTDEQIITLNRHINTFPHCRYIECKENTGRSAIRNFLVRESQYNWLLFIDSRMRVRKEDFLQTYLEQDNSDVVYGGYIVEEDVMMRHCLRYLYERHFLLLHPATERQRHPYHDFHTSNFLIRRSVLDRIPFDERFKHYGYEDVLYGRRLEEGKMDVHHIDNAVLFSGFESNETFIEKTEVALYTLYTFRHELKGYSRMIQLSEKLRRWRMLWLVRLGFRIFGKHWRKKCVGERPTLRSFNLYRLGFYSNIKG